MRVSLTSPRMIRRRLLESFFKKWSEECEDLSAEAWRNVLEKQSDVPQITRVVTSYFKKRIRAVQVAEVCRVLWFGC